MDFLALCRRTAREAGIPGNGPATVVNQAGEMGRVVGWVAEAWMAIARRQLWSWLWESTTVTIPAGTNSVAGSIPAARYMKDKTYNGATPLSYRPWDDFCLMWPTFGVGEPSDWTISPDNAIVVNSKPAADLVLSVQRYARPTELAANTDTPPMPAEFHMAIVWRALMDAADYDEAGIARAMAGAKYAEVLGDGLSEGVSNVRLGDALL